MITILKRIAASFRTTTFILSMCLGDLKEQDARKRVRSDNGPAIAWEVGRMLDYRCNVLGLLGVAKGSPYTAADSGEGASGRKDQPDNGGSQHDKGRDLR